MEKKYIKRDLSDVMLEMYQYFPVITITGPANQEKPRCCEKYSSSFLTIRLKI